VLFAVFGLGAWLEIVGIWAEMFLLIQHTPEQEKLPSRLAFIVQVANFIPILLGSSASCRSGADIRRYIIVILVGGIGALLFAAFTWNVTVIIAGSELSICLYAATLIGATFDASSNLFVWQFSARYGSRGTVSMSFGQNLTAVCFAIAILQKAIGFSIALYFLLLAFLGSCSVVAFLLIPQRGPADPLAMNGEDDLRVERAPHWTRFHRPWFGALFGLSFIQNGLLPSLLPLTTGSYNLYFLLSTVPGFIQPLSVLLVLWSKDIRLIWIGVTCSIAMAIATCTLVLESGMTEQWQFIIFLCVVMLGCNGTAYSKAAILSRLPSDMEDLFPDDVMRCAGMIIQTGSFVGALLFFICVNAL